MNILYLSAFCESSVFDQIFEKSQIKPNVAAQKFHRLFTKGLSAMEDVKVDALSVMKIPAGVNFKPVYTFEKPLRIHHLRPTHVPFLGGVYQFLSILFFTLKWAALKKKESSVIVCDVLGLSSCVAAYFARKFTGRKTVGVVTDLPNLIVTAKSSLLLRWHSMLVNFLITRFDAYIILTKQMDAVVNPASRPSHIMEGMADGDAAMPVLSPRKGKIIMYAGGLFEKYGAKTLVDAFTSLNRDDAELHLYGSGDMEEYISQISADDKRVKFFGMMPNDIVVERLSEATLLVNPRPTAEEFTKYSFPSKNIEYMLSGIPLLTTKLPGMPPEYNPHVFLLEEETISGMSRRFEEILAKDRSELDSFGRDANRFIMSQKTNYMQARKVISFIKEQVV